MTTQLAIHPAQATNDDFEWRVSIARLDASAPFSVFEGIERRLAVLQGEMTLVRPSQPPQTLTPQSLPVQFAGSEVVEGRVGRGPVLDLNIMYRPPQWHAEMRRMQWSTETAFSMAGPAVLCSLAGELNIDIDSKPLRLAQFDAVVVRRHTPVRVTTAHCVAAYLIEFSANADIAGAGRRV